MKAKQTVEVSGSDRAQSPPLHERARPHAKGIGYALDPCKKRLSRKAVTVEVLLTWAYGREKVHLARPPGLDGGSMFAARGFSHSSSSERVGAAVGSSLNFGFEAPADAYAARYAVEEQGGAAMLVRDYAIIGSRPDWVPHPVILVERGREVMDMRSRRPSFCEVFFRGDLPEIVAERRTRYRRWAQAIAAIHTLLAGDALSDHVLTPALPPMSPWDDFALT